MVAVKFRSTVWTTFLDLIHAQKYWMKQIADDFSITPQMAQALHVLPTADSLTMKELAGEMWCDASNMTGLIDRLEARGLVERQPSAADRRVKCVVLTAAGKRLRRRIDDRFSEAPPAIAALSDADRQTLHEILARALENAEQQRRERPE
jgi:DNA-binding MarR family transcriptional regulator